MQKTDIVKRYIVFIISLFFIGLGLACVKHAAVGIAPVSSVANVVSLKYTALSFGTWLFFSNCLFLLGQIVLLRRRFHLFQLMQIPLSFLFGFFTDCGLWITQAIPNDWYPVKLVLILVGCVLLGIGIALGAEADVLLNSPEAFVKTLAGKLKKNFGSTKIVFDICWVLVAVLLSLLLFSGELMGIREGTVISALLVGFCVKCFQPVLHKLLYRYIFTKSGETE